MSGMKPRWRDVDGILLLDKPAGRSSNHALQAARRQFQARKAGHTGSLDPFATGMLAICFGQATKVCSYLLAAGKTYQVECELGRRTSTGDPEGEIIEEQPVPELDVEMVSTVMGEFVGEIQQVPPMYSALKHQGRRLYELARQGVEIERPPRRVTIKNLRLCGLNGHRLSFEVSCSKGTYVRTLVEDIAQRLGTVAYTTMLRRLVVEPFAGRSMIALDQVEALPDTESGAADHWLLPVDAALVAYPRTNLDESQANDLVHGRAVGLDADHALGVSTLYGPDDGFLGIGEVGDGGVLKPLRLMATNRN